LFTTNDLKTINIAYVQDVQVEKAMDPLKDVLETAEITEGVPLFNIRYSDMEEAGKALENDDIKAYIVNDGEPKLYVKRNGINETIIKSFIDSYKRASYTIQSILIKQPDAINQGLLDDVMQYKSFTNEKKSSVEPNVILIYYYALLAFCCLFAANWGLDEVVNIQANRSGRGARVNVSPIHKMKLLLINILAAFTANVGSIILMLLYMTKVLNISFGNHMPQLILACFVGSITGLFIGATVGVWVNKSSGVQGAIVTSIIMVGAFLSGMMFGDMKYIIAKNVPILSYINPMNLLSDSFYSLYYYDTFDRFYLNITILVFMAVIMGAASYLGLRRKTYASI
jgi:ABC-2 type transport system permease protein